MVMVRLIYCYGLVGTPKVKEGQCIGIDHGTSIIHVIDLKICGPEQYVICIGFRLFRFLGEKVMIHESRGFI